LNKQLNKLRFMLTEDKKARLSFWCEKILHANNMTQQMFFDTQVGVIWNRSRHNIFELPTIIFQLRDIKSTMFFNFSVLNFSIRKHKYALLSLDFYVNTCYILS